MANPAQTPIATTEQAIQLLLQECPSFSATYGEHLEDYGTELPYVAAGTFARHLLRLHQQGASDQLAAVGRAIEALHGSSTDSVREFATIGVLEAIQNVWSNEGVDPSGFSAFLGPESRRWWYGLEDFWSGKAPVVKAKAEESGGSSSDA